VRAGAAAGAPLWVVVGTGPGAASAGAWGVGAGAEFGSVGTGSAGALGSGAASARVVVLTSGASDNVRAAPGDSAGESVTSAEKTMAANPRGLEEGI
jgi:hypothetical protein